MAVIGYYDMSLGQGNPDMVDDIVSAGHTAVDITSLSPAELAGIDTLYVWNPDNTVYGSEYLSAMSSIDAAVQSGMNLVVFDRAVGNADINSALPGATGFNDVRSTGEDAQLTPEGAAMFGSGPGGGVSNTSLDGVNYTVHGYVDAASLPAGSTVLITDGVDPGHAVGFEYSHGAGTVQYFAMPMDYANETSPAWEGFSINVLSAVTTICIAASARVRTTFGLMPVGLLRPGMRLPTRDHGIQPLIGLHRGRLGKGELLYRVPGTGRAGQALWLTRQHRVLVTGAMCELASGHDTALARCGHIPGLARRQAQGTMVANPLLPLHAAIEVEGHWVESLEPGPRSRIALGRALRAAAHQSFLVGMGYPELSRVETLVATSREAFLH